MSFKHFLGRRFLQINSDFFLKTQAFLSEFICVYPCPIEVFSFLAYLPYSLPASGLYSFPASQLSNPF
jgi:hypothetical protein